MTARLKVVYLDHCARLSGAELALVRLLSALHEVRATVILAEHGPLVDRLEALGIHVEVMSMVERSRDLRREAIAARRSTIVAAADTLRYSARLARRLRQLRPDLVVSNSLKSHVYGGLATRAARVPIVWHLHDRIATDYLPDAALRLVRRAATALPTAVIANSSTTLASLPTLSGARPITKVVGNVCTLVDEPPAGRDRQPGPLVVGMVGRLTPWKGQDLFLRAFASAFGGGNERAVLVGAALFGEEQYERRLRQLAVDLDIGPQVLFAGHVDEPWPIMTGFDVLVHASVIPEPFGQVVVEGMALGLCVVAADEGGPAEIVHHGRDGLLFPSGDVTALAATLRELSQSHRRRETLAASARQAVLCFGAKPIAEQELAVYRSVLA